MNIEVDDIIYVYEYEKYYKVLEVREVDRAKIFNNPSLTKSNQYRISNERLPFIYKYFTTKKLKYLKEMSLGIWVTQGKCRLHKKGHKPVSFRSESEYYMWLSRRLD